MYCTYRTESTKLFEEVETGLRGLNAGKPNLSVWAALLDNLIKGTTLKDVFMVLNCPAPSYSGLQCNANKVGPLIVDMVREDLKRERTLLIYVLESYGFPRQILIPMEGTRCPDHPGKCTTSIQMDQPIGREDLATEEICQDLLSDSEPTYIGQITTDGDSAAYRGVQIAMGEHGQTVEALRDTRHLAHSQKKVVNNAKISDMMFPG
uniref:Mutator-like transposase domain-containing protein n=1 Tax=Magallana gigas TaxID=29159 RepID=A0A8W8NJK9_MAGGI